MKYKNILRKIFFSSQIPISLLNNEFQTVCCFPSVEHSFLPSHFVKLLIDNYKEAKLEENKPFIKTGNFDIHIGIIPIENNQYMILGPTSFHKQDITRFVSNFPSKISRDESIILYRVYKEASNSSLVRFSNLMSLTYQLIYNKEVEPLTLFDQDYESRLSKELPISTKLAGDAENIILFEKQIHNAVATGKKHELDLILKHPFPIISQRSSLTKQDIPYLIIPYLTILSRAAIDGKARAENVFNLYNTYTESSYLVNNTIDMAQLCIKASYDFCDLVKENTEKNYHPEICQICEKYITEHLSEKIIAQDLAHICNVDRKYIFEIFKNNYNCTVNEYIQKERLNRAIVLLTSSNYTIGQIASSLGYPSQGYFTKVFKKYFDCTPSQYLEK